MWNTTGKPRGFKLDENLWPIHRKARTPSTGYNWQLLGPNQNNL